MAKTSFVRTVTPADASPEAEQSPESSSANTGTLTAPNQTLAHPEPNGAPDQVEGEIDFSDINLDRINLVQKSGNLSNEFAPGAFVIGKEVILASKDAEFNFVVLKIKKQYQEDLPYDASGQGEKPQRYNTAKEVRDAGGSLQWGDANYYRDIATALVLIPAPEGLSEDDRESKFIYEDATGARYALALWSLFKTSYTAAAKKIFTAKLVGHLKAGFENGVWKCSSEMKTNAGNSWFQPVIRPAGATTPEFKAFAKEVLASLTQQ